jgi:hypothetical protein
VKIEVDWMLEFLLGSSHRMEGEDRGRLHA